MGWLEDLLGQVVDLNSAPLVYSLSPKIAEKSARIRAMYPAIKAPDAIHLATAISSGASAFLTNDAQLSSIPDIKVLVLKNLKTDS